MNDELRRLANHISMSHEERNKESLAWNLWQADKNKIFPDVAKLCDDVLICLDAANHELNGLQPSRIADGPRSEPSQWLSIQVFSLANSCHEYALIWEKQGLFTAEERTLLHQCGWMITMGWLYILHGDIDDLVEEVKLSGEIKEVL